ncbi:MAG TPA: undecaprenyl-diphosphatase [Albidovulum sp.]|uniref:undecaprenyl-diphosphatase n=1 Tax=Albidovulum sp. TaxID=1872424 RepID=UPI002BA6ADA6|nr:undecaprenyl-diphosphatase [Albidovulum sp.]
MTLQAIEAWNQRAFLAMNADPQSSTMIIKLASVLASWPNNLAVVLLLLAWVRRGAEARSAVLDALLTASIGLLIARAISAAWYHPRPFEIGLGHQYLAHRPDASFPSDHGTFMFALALCYFLRPALRRWGVGLLMLGGLVAWARIYLGVHFPLDMVGAFGVAFVAALMVRRAEGPLHRAVYSRLSSVYESVLRWLGLPQLIFPRNL